MYCIKYITLHQGTLYNTNLVTSLVYTEYVWKALFLRNRNRFYLNSRSYSEINSVYPNKQALCHHDINTTNLNKYC